MTADNPYQSPESPGGLPASHDPTSDGLWRHGKLLVMRNQNPRFPPRCVKTNEPCSGPPTRFKLAWVENGTMWALMFGAIGHSVAMASQGKKLSVDLPLSDTWLARKRRSTMIGWGLLLGGIGSFVLAVVCYVVALLSGASEGSVLWLMFFILGGPLAAIAGIIWMAIFQQPPVKAHEITDGLAWIKGVHPDFLASLPEWPWGDGAS